MAFRSSDFSQKRLRSRPIAAWGVAIAVLVSACSDSTTKGPKAAEPEDAGPDAPAVRERPAGSAADVSEEITGGNGPFIAAAAGLVVPDGYVAHEYVASGMAEAYASKAALGDDGQWSLESGTPAEYRTRVLVLRPGSASRASGTVIVEWLNVSGGADANPDYASLEEEITRQGHTWVGVSAQLIGVEGGAVLVKVPGADSLAGKGLKAMDPARYGSLKHPGDGYSFDIFTQVARAALKSKELLGGITPRVLLAAGESQSAFALTTYYDGVQPLTLAFDGFLIHSRGGTSLPLVAPGASADLAGSIGSTTHPIFRADLDAPVMDIQTEGDIAGILNSGIARQPDSDRFRLWEVTGTAHADAHLIGAAGSGIDCGVPINNGPMHLVAKAALRSLDAWVRSGERPPIAPHVELTSDAAPAVARDGDGIALGGIRTPPVDVPVDVLSGAPGPNTDVICLLLGSTKPLPAARIAELYSSRSAYQDKYDAAADGAIKAGFVLEPDRDALLAFAQPSRVQP